MPGPAMRPPPRPFAARAEAPLHDIDFDGREPSSIERIWGAVAYPDGFGYRLATPLAALSMHFPEHLFGTPERVEAGHARARALLKARAEAEADRGGE